MSLHAYGVDHLLGRHPTQNGDGKLGPDAAYRDQLFKQCLLGGTQKSVERECVLPHVSVDVQRDLAADCGQFGKCRNADDQVISDAASFDDGLVGMLGQQLSAQMSNHRKQSSVVGRQSSAESFLRTDN